MHLELNNDPNICAMGQAESSLDGNNTSQLSSMSKLVLNYIVLINYIHISGY